MTDNSVDPSGNTEAFRAFTRRAAAQEPPSASRVPLLAGLGVVVAVLLVVVWTALG